MNEYELDNLYFKDAFDLCSDGINIFVNNVKASCITSSSNKFQIDSEGNLVVKTIHTTDENLFEVDYQKIFNMIYPIGSIYMSANSINPSVLFGGTWIEWGQGRVPVGINPNDSDFNTSEKVGGIKNHNHTSPSHNHSIPSHTHAAGSLYAQFSPWSNAISFRRISTENWVDNFYFDGLARKVSSDNNSYGAGVAGITAFGGNGNTGSTTPENTGTSSSLQPYITCYMWKRLS